MKTIDRTGVIFYTNYNSQKGKELEENPFAAAVFFWESLHRQIRIEGRVEKIPADQSENYFHSRPRDSQISAAVSPQSSVVQNRTNLEEEWTRLRETYSDPITVVPYPPHWGGFKLCLTALSSGRDRQTDFMTVLCSLRLKRTLGRFID